MKRVLHIAVLAATLFLLGMPFVLLAAEWVVVGTKLVSVGSSAVTIDRLGPLWTPDAERTLAWWDAADMNTVTNVSGAASDWESKAFRPARWLPRTFSQDTPAARPAYGTRTLNSLPVLDLDGSNDNMLLPTGLTIPVRDRTMLVVVVPDDLTANKTLLGHDTVNLQYSFSDGGTRYAASAPYWSVRQLSLGNVPIATRYGLGISTGKGQLSGWSDLQGNLQLSANGEWQTSNSMLVDPNGEQRFNMLGNYTAASDWWNGGVAEIIVTESTDSFSRNRTEGYLAHKWGISSDLPDNHPYKTSPPSDSDFKQATVNASYFALARTQESDSAVVFLQPPPDPPPYVIGGEGGTGNRRNSNLILGYELPVIPVGSTIVGAELYAEACGWRLASATSLFLSSVDLLDIEDPAAENPTDLFYAPLAGEYDTWSNSWFVGRNMIEDRRMDGDQTTLNPSVPLRRTLSDDSLGVLKSHYVQGRSNAYFRYGITHRDPNNFYQLNRYSLCHSTPDKLRFTVYYAEPEPWTPADMMNVVLWLDANDSATLFADVDGITNAVDNGKIALWRDKSGFGRDFAQVDDGIRPTLKIANQNGKSVATFNTSRMYMGSGLDLANSVIHQSYFAAYNTTATAQQTIIHVSTGDNILSKQRHEIRSGNGVRRIGGRRFDTDQLHTTTGGTAYTGPQSIGAVYNNIRLDEIVSWKLYVDANLLLDFSPLGMHGFGGPTGATDSDIIILGDNRQVSWDRFRGDIYELVVTGSVPSTSERQKLEGYFAHKWGFTVRLPTGHPYKDAPPMK